MKDSAVNKEYEASLKSIETENYLDKSFYRPIGFRIAKMLCNTSVTPNTVTIISIFIGAAAGPLFYLNNIYYNLLGILSLILANILDCVDGQLARLSGIKSKIGRILDGLAGDIWFTVIYVSLALKLKNEYDTSLFFIPATISGISHLVQANITDYYKTLHLYFLSREKGYEFRNSREISKQHKEMKKGTGKALFLLYMAYTFLQEKLTPGLQTFLHNLDEKYGDDIPDQISTDITRKSKKVMKTYLDLMTFNGRSIILFLSVLLSGFEWIYFAYEIIILNIILVISICKYEKIFRYHPLSSQGGGEK